MIVFLHHQPGHLFWYDYALLVLLPLIVCLLVVNLLNQRTQPPGDDG